VASGLSLDRVEVGVTSIGRALCVLMPWMVHGIPSVLGMPISCTQSRPWTRGNPVKGTGGRCTVFPPF
jgi:hypothetical protein